jgi:hypothetical protein
MLAAASRTFASTCTVRSKCSSYALVANGLQSWGSSTSARYTPSTDRSSVDSRASSCGVRATSLATNSTARNATNPGQCSAALNRRLANAAARQGGIDARGANVRCRARNKRSLVADGAILLAETMTRCWGGAKLSDSIREYSWVVNSLRSTLSASPGGKGLQRQGVGETVSKKDCGRGDRAVPFDRAQASVYAPCPERSSYAVTMQDS